MKNQKQRIFKLIAILLPFIFLIIIELFLKLFNLFPQTPLFIEDENQNIITINSTVGERYFNKKKLSVPNLYPQIFAAKKGANTFRIFCLGGSTTAGFPYEMTVPFPQQLKFMLQNDYPDKQFEVINLGLSAINSFTVLDWIPEIIKYDPDLVLIYVGHNEFYGAFGTCSVVSLGNNGALSRFMLKMQKIRIFQALKTLANFFTSDISSNMNVTLMEKIVDDRSVPPDSKLHADTYENYSENLDIIFRKLTKKKIPVIMSNLVSNLKDQAPLGKNGKYSNENLVAQDFYKNGLTELSENDSVNALHSFVDALNRDEIPFRAPEKINSIIEGKVKLYKLNFVDMLKAFKENSSNGIPGDNLFCDHLHPNPVGYHLMAKQFCEKIYSMNFFPTHKSKIELKVPLFVTQLDWEIGGLRVFKLEQKWPFFSDKRQYSGLIDPDRKPVVEIAENFLFNHHIWGKAHSDMANYYENKQAYRLACNEYKAILAVYPKKLDYYLKLLVCAQKANNWQLMEKTGQQALALTSVKGMLYYRIAFAQRNQGDLKTAFKNINKSLSSGDLTHEQLGYTFYLKALILTDIKEYKEARKILEVIIDEAPGFKAARELLDKINTI